MTHRALPGPWCGGLSKSNADWRLSGRVYTAGLTCGGVVFSGGGGGDGTSNFGISHQC